ncbi:MAG: hypothetical protein JWO06_1921 [Bacteroidota bacterium]|nr:hypothetical protein [Bacteroidota bacterium]
MIFFDNIRNRISEAKQSKSLLGWFFDNGLWKTSASSPEIACTKFFGFALLAIAIPLVIVTKPDQTWFLDILNIMFLAFIILTLKFREQFTLSPDDPVIRKMLHVENWKQEDSKLAVEEAAENGNQAIRQFSSIKQFWIGSLLLYVLMLVRSLITSRDLRNWLKGHPHYWDISYLFYSTYRESIDKFGNDVFQIGSVLLSNLAVYGLILGFYVLYYPSTGFNNKAHKENTSWCLVGIVVFSILHGLILLQYLKIGTDGAFLFEKTAMDITLMAQFFSGLINTVAMAFFIARFASPLLRIPAIVQAILFLYTILQTGLMIVLMDGSNKDFIFLHDLWLPWAQKGILLFCLFGKIVLYLVVLYLYTTGKLFFYFVSMRAFKRTSDLEWSEIIENIGNFSFDERKLYMQYYSIQVDGDNHQRAYLEDYPEIEAEGNSITQIETELKNKILGD